MSRLYQFDGLGSFQGLERKLSLSAVAVSTALPDDLPPPGPEPDPGPLPTEDPPIAHPPMTPTYP